MSHCPLFFPQRSLSLIIRTPLAWTLVLGGRMGVTSHLRHHCTHTHLWYRETILHTVQKQHQTNCFSIGSKWLFGNQCYFAQIRCFSYCHLVPQQVICQTTGLFSQSGWILIQGLHFKKKILLTLLNIRENAHLHLADPLHEVTVIQTLEDYTRTPTLQDVLCGFNGLLLSSASFEVTSIWSILFIKLIGNAVPEHLF